MSDKPLKIGLTGLNAIDSPGPGVRCGPLFKGR